MNDLCPKCESENPKLVHRESGIKDGEKYLLLLFKCDECGWEGEYGDLLPGWTKMIGELNVG